MTYDWKQPVKHSELLLTFLQMTANVECWIFYLRCSYRVH